MNLVDFYNVSLQHKIDVSWRCKNPNVVAVCTNGKISPLANPTCVYTNILFTSLPGLPDRAIFCQMGDF
jgi:hypothetical protein